MLNAAAIKQIGFLSTKKIPNRCSSLEKVKAKKGRTAYFNTQHQKLLNHFKDSDWFTAEDATNFLDCHPASGSRYMRDLEQLGKVHATTDKRICNVLGAKTNVKLYKVKKECA